MTAALIRASLGGAVAVAVVWAICRLLPRLSPAVRTTLWWLAAAKFLISLVWISPLEIPILPAATVNVAQTSGAAAAVGVARSDAPSAAAAWNIETLVVSLWGAGSAIALILGMRQWRRASAIVRASRPASYDLNVLTSDLAGRLGIAAVPAVLESELIETPLVTGLRRPAIVVPASFHSLLPDQQRMALCHELAHVKRADLRLGAIPALAERIFFFHPLVHVAAREYSIWREAACDRDVLDALDAAPDEYGRLLVDLGVSRPRAGLAAAGASWSFTSLKRRLSMLTESPNRSKYSRAIAISAVGAAALTLLPLTLSARAVTIVPVQAQTQAVEKPQAPKELPAIRAVLFSEKTRLRGERNDVVKAMAYRTGEEKLAWFQIGDSEYVLRDAALLTRLEDAWVKAITTEEPADSEFIDALLKRFADGGRATKVK
jgi:beta-lactamase regulating signal transducer with metallopeptidase domain